jgi:glycosyltransferase involved in cell wall biosynthesis
MTSDREPGSSPKPRSTRPRVLVVGPRFPNGGGVGMVDQTLLESQALNECFDMALLDTSRGERGSGKEGSFAAINFVYIVGQTWTLLKILVTRRPAILHQTITWGLAFWKESWFMLLARLFRVKVVGHVHGSELDEQIAQANWIEKALLKRAFRIPHVLIVLNEAWRERLATQVSGAVDLRVVANCVDRAIAVAMGQTAPKAADAEKLVLFLGWLGERKGILEALEAAHLVRQKMAEVRFVFAGQVASGPRKEEVERACREAAADEGICFPGLVTGDDKLALLSRASVFILPSYHENLPVAIIEAMAMGIPVVSTVVAGIPELIEEGVNGFLIQPGDTPALAERIVRLLEDGDLRRAMGAANAVKARQRYHPRVFANKIALVYREVLAGKPE